MRNPIAESDSGRTLQLVYCDENGKLKTDPEAITALQNLKGPIAVVSLFGKSLHGKSFIWNQLLSRSSGFEVQTLHRPCSGDIWMWIEPVKRVAEDGTEYNVVLLDVEAADSHATKNSQIFALAILLSTVFIYGPALGVNDIELDDLSRILEISNVGEITDNAFSGLGKFSPMFVQLMTDINSETVKGGEDVTQNNKRGKLQPHLLHGINSLMRFVSERVRPKKRGEIIVTGPPLAGFTKSFSENVNRNIMLNISSSWQSVEELEARKARDMATEVYTSSFERSETPVEESMLIEAHSKAVVKALTAFCESSIGNTEVKQKYERDLWSFFTKAFEEHKRVANIEAYSRCCNAIEDMGKKLWALPCSHDANIDDMIKALDNAVAEYEVSINGPMKWQTLSSFLRKSIQDILVHRRGNQIDELVSENSKLKVQHREMENAMDLLKKQIEGGEKMKKEYQKRYENAIDDMGKLSDQFKHRIRDLESKCKSIHDEHSKLMEVLGSTRLEASEWKRKYEETLDENGNASSNRNARITSCVNKSIDWKIKYENVINEKKAMSEKIAAMEERLTEVSVKENGMRAEFTRVLDEKEKVITEKDTKLATMEKQLESLCSELKKSELKVEEILLEAKGLNEDYKSMVELLKTEIETLRREKDELEKKHLSQLEEFEKLDLKLKNEEIEKKLVELSKIEADEAARINEEKLQTSLQEQRVEIEELKNICLKVTGEMEIKLQKLSDKNQVMSRIDILEQACSKLKEAETEAATAKELVSSMKTEVEAARINENKLQTLLHEKSVEIDRAKGIIEELERQKMELSEKLETRAKQNAKTVSLIEKEDSVKVSDEETEMVQQRVKRLRVETTIKATDFAQDTEEEEDTDSQESGKAMSMMTPRKCTTSTEAGGASSSSPTGMAYLQYTMKKLRSEITKRGFGAKLVVLKNPRKRELLELYERCVLRK